MTAPSRRRTVLAALGPNGLAEASALSLLLAVMAGLVLAAQARIAARRPVAALGGFRPLAPRAAGPVGRMVAALLGLYLAVVLGLPLVSLLVAAATPAVGVPLNSETATLGNVAAVLAPGANTLGAFANSLLLAGGAALVLALLVVPAGIAARRRWIGAAIDLPYALPGVCVGVAMILVYLKPLPILGVSLYGTLALIGIAYLARFFALALKPVAAARAALDPRLGEAAAMLGARGLRRLASIDLPLLAAAAVAGFLLVALSALNESGQVGMAAATALLALALVAMLMALASLAGRRLPRGALPWQG